MIAFDTNHLLMGFERETWIRVLKDLLEDPVFAYDNSARLWKTVERYREGKADFDDYLILGHSGSIGANCVHVCSK